MILQLMLPRTDLLEDLDNHAFDALGFTYSGNDFLQEL